MGGLLRHPSHEVVVETATSIPWPPAWPLSSSGTRSRVRSGGRGSGALGHDVRAGHAFAYQAPLDRALMSVGVAQCAASLWDAAGFDVAPPAAAATLSIQLLSSKASTL